MVSPSSGFGLQVPELQQALTAYQDGVQQMGVHADDIGQSHAPAGDYGTFQQDWAQIGEALSAIGDSIGNWVSGRAGAAADLLDQFSRTIRQGEEDFRRQQLDRLHQAQSGLNQVSPAQQAADRAQQLDRDAADSIRGLVPAGSRNAPTTPLTPPPVMRSPNG